jgi:methylenetetrahydrofolate--tRNA-(uracil-5-)-methyltransferase
MQDVIVIGGGLAGCEAAWQAARNGLKVRLFEMRPGRMTGAHLTGGLAELVCSNSLGSNLPDRASGVLKAELRLLGSLLLECAEKSALPAGAALAVDRGIFSGLVTERIRSHPNIEIVRREFTEVPATPAIIASGPLTSESLAKSIAQLSGEDHLFFFDAIAPIVRADTIDMSIAFRGSRYNQGEAGQGDYINCPFSKEQYRDFVAALRSAGRIELRSFEDSIRSGVKAGQFFEGCLPVEIISECGEDSLAFGPMRPTGLKDPRSGRRPYAVVQLRQDNLQASLYNLVGFQTNLKFPEQRRVFRLIPGLEKAEFERYGQMHRNTFIASPKILRPSLQHITRDDLFFAGQITGVEGYMGNIATGLLAGINIARGSMGQPPLVLPRETMLGALCHYITHADLKDFQPMKANFGILPALEDTAKTGRRERGKMHAERALADLSFTINRLTEGREIEV